MVFADCVICGLLGEWAGACVGVLFELWLLGFSCGERVRSKSSKVRNEMGMKERGRGKVVLFTRQDSTRFRNRMETGGGDILAGRVCYASAFKVLTVALTWV